MSPLEPQLSPNFIVIISPEYAFHLSSDCSTVTHLQAIDPYISISLALLNALVFLTGDQRKPIWWSRRSYGIPSMSSLSGQSSLTSIDKKGKSDLLLVAVVEAKRALKPNSRRMRGAE